MTEQLLSAPDEPFADHVDRCLCEWAALRARFRDRLLATFQARVSDDRWQTISNAVHDMLAYHDLGKLTRQWQTSVSKGQKTPPHAAIGATWLFKNLTYASTDLRNATAFAVAIHHLDRGTLGENIERPDVQAIQRHLVDDEGNISWADGFDKPIRLGAGFQINRPSINVFDMKRMARELRTWSRGTAILVQHKRRLQATLLLHILKVCDIRAAKDRKDLRQRDGPSPFVTTITEGGLLQW